jgi:hypothetical protein
MRDLAAFRYVTEQEDGTISLQPAPKLTPSLISQTVDIACNFFFLALAIITEHCPDQATANQMESCWVQYKQLTAERG